MQKHAVSGVDPNSSDDDVLGLQVLGALLRPAASVAARLGIPLKAVGEAAEIAYFRRARHGNRTQADIAAVLKVSVRTVANLSRQLKRELLDGSQTIELTRKVEFLLWSEPLTELRIAQALPEISDADIGRALRSLLDEGRIKRSDGRTPLYEAVRSATRLVDRKGWLSRLDGLHSLLETVSHAVTARFLATDASSNPATTEPADRAFVRNLQLRVCPDDLPALRELYETHIFPTLVALDAKGNADPDAVAMSVAYLFAEPPAP